MFELKDYLSLVDDTGRILREDKRGAIKASTANILERLNIPLENWLNITQEFMTLFKGPAGSLLDLQRYSAQLGLQRVAHACSCRHWHS